MSPVILSIKYPQDWTHSPERSPGLQQSSEENLGTESINELVSIQEASVHIVCTDDASQ